MTVFRRKRAGGKVDKTYFYEFQFQGITYRGSTRQILRDSAELFERLEKDRVRRLAAGLPIEPRDDDTPLIQDWAEEFYTIHARRVTVPERIDFLLRPVLRFFGAKPAPGSDVPVDEAAPYHNLRLGDVVKDPYWIERFERWMESRGQSAQTRNHYRSIMSVMYKVASEPTYRTRTRVYTNPFVGIHREKTRGRQATLTPDEMQRWIGAASYHVRLAVAIGVLVPKLRIGSILKLQWADNIDLDRRLLTTWVHKTVARTRIPQVAPIPAQLVAILEDARRRFPRTTHVVTYRGRPIASIRDGVRAALERAAIPYGRAAGITFHSIRHTAATMLRRIGVDAITRKEVMGHEDLATTLLYDHVNVDDQIAPTERLSSTFPIQQLVTAKRLRAKGKSGEDGQPTPSASREKSQTMTGGQFRKRSR